jgi:uncharacterized protein
MKLEQSFTVNAPVEQVWTALVNVERVAPCLPGAEITGQSPDGGYEGTFTVKLGPATASYRGSLRMESLDEANRVATMTAKGTDKRGQGGANASIVSTMHQEGDGTVVEVMTDFVITGRLARFGRGGMIEDISKRLMRDFAQCLESTLGTEPEPAAAPEAAPAQPAAVASGTGAVAEEPLTPAPEGATAPPSEHEAAEAAIASAGGAAAEAAAADAPTQTYASVESASPAGPTAPADAPPAEPAAPADVPPAEPAALAESPAPGLAAEPGPLPGDTRPAGAVDSPTADGPGASMAGEPDPWGPLSPPSESAPTPTPTPTPTPDEPPPRTGSIPPPPAAVRPAPQQQAAKPVQGLSLLFSVLWERVKRFISGLFSRRRKN